MKKRLSVVIMSLIALLLASMLSACSLSSAIKGFKEGLKGEEETVETVEEEPQDISEEPKEEEPSEEELLAQQKAQEEIEKLQKIDDCIAEGFELLKGHVADENAQKAFEKFKEAGELGSDDGYFLAGYTLDYAITEENKKGIDSASFYEKCADTNPYAAICMTEVYRAGILHYDTDKIKEYADKASTLLESYPEPSDDMKYVTGHLLGLRYYFDDYGLNDTDQAITCLSESADRDNSYAMNILGYIYGTDPDFLNKEKSIDWYKKGATLMNSACMCNLAHYFINGDIGGEPDYDMAKQLYQTAINLGSRFGYRNLGAVYYYGQGVDVDYEKSFELYQKGAALNDSYCMNGLAYQYDFGEGVEQDSERAVELYTKAAELGYSQAMYNLACVYDDGNYLDRDVSKAIEWYEKALAADDADSGFYLGRYYLFGEDVEQDYDKAMDYFLQGADLGSASAMEGVGYLYENGFGVDKDKEKAKEWYNKAEEAGAGE